MVVINSSQSTDSKSRLLYIVTPLGLLTLSACGGGSSSSGSSASAVNGSVIKGLLSNALVGLDFDGDGTVDSSTVRTGTDGSYSISTTNSTYTIIATTDGTTIDTSSGAVLSGITLKAPKDASVVTPTTTLIEEADLTPDQVASVLGLPDGVDPLAFNPFADGVDAVDALAVEKISQQIISVVNSYASAAEGAGASEADAFSSALQGLVEVVKDKAANLTDATANQADKLLDLTKAEDLTLIKTETSSQVASIADIDVGSFNRVADDTATAILNVNTKIAAVTDLTSDETKNIFSTVQVLADQVQDAAEAEKTSEGSGSISFTDPDAVDQAADNAAPTDISLSASSISEAASSLVIGTLSTTDADQATGAAFSYALAEVEGTDYAAFTINQSTGELSLKEQPDYETKTSYTITIISTDAGGKSFSKSFTISVTDASEPPTLTVPTGGAVTEDATTETVTGTLSATDPEGDTLTYSVVGSTASSGNHTVVGTYGTLVLNASTGAYTYTLNNSATAVNTLTASDTKTESFSVQVTDGTNTTDAQSLSFTITGSNDAPEITVSDLSDIAENSANAIAATVAASDAEDSSVTLTISGNGRDDDKFEIVDGKLRIKTSADFEAQDTYQVQLSATDSTGITTLRNLEFSVTDVSETLSGSVVDGYVAGATIFQDLNNNNVLDSDEPFTVTSSTGEFILSGIVSSKTAPLKMISGFDIGTNQAIVTSLGVPTTISGNAVASPIASITAISQADSVDASLNDVLDRVATYLDVSATSQSNSNILNDDPITNLASSDSDTANAARDVFEANQFVMGLTHIAEKTGKYLADYIDTSIQSAGDNAYGTYAGGAASSYEKLGADAFLNTAATHIMTPVTPTSANAFQISSAQIEWKDYDPTLDVDVTNRVVSTTTDNQVSLGSDAVALNLQNLTNSTDNSGNYKPPTLSFELIKVPTGTGSGTVTFSLIDGLDSTRSSGERQINLDIEVNWEGDGETATVTVPNQTLSGYYLTSSDLRVDFTIENLDSDVISITNNSSSLDVKLASIIDKLEAVGSTSLLKAGNFNLTVTTDLPLSDASGTSITSVAANIALVQNTPLEIFVEDVTYFEDDNSPQATFYLNHAHTEDVTITYNIAASETDTATVDSDFTGQSAKTVTILAGLTSATVALPVLADSTVESSETFSVTATATSAGSLKKATGTVTLEDSDTTISTSGELDSLATDVVTALTNDISAALLAAYQSAATTAGTTLNATSSTIEAAAASITPGLTTVIKAFYGIVASEITTAATNNTAAADYAQALMTANSATKLFDPSTFVGTYIYGDGSYVGSNDLTTLTAAIQTEYNTFKTYAVETVGDVFGTDTAANFAGAVVNMLTTGNDDETLTSASEIIPTFDGVDTVNAGDGNDKVIGGSDVDTFYGQGGNDHLYGYRGNDVLDGGDGNDKIVGGLGDDQISGGAGDDYILAQTGDDTISTGTGTDEVIAGLGDDIITIDGAGSKTINGGTGTDSLVISDGSSNTLTDYTIEFDTSSDTTSFINGSDRIDFMNIEKLSVNSENWIVFKDGIGYKSDGTTYDVPSGNNDYLNGFFSSTSNTIKLLEGGSSGSDEKGIYLTGWLDEFGFTPGSELTIYGSDTGDYIRPQNNSDEDTININAEAGDDLIIIYDRGSKTDVIDAGAGDDIVRVGTDFATDTLNGGDGSDTVSFRWYGFEASSGATFNLATHSTNFENIIGSYYDDVLTGDNNANNITGDNAESQYGEGADTISGLGGNDTLSGNGGDDQIDGGTGADTITTGSGTDTIILRAGDGGSTLAGADIITDFTDGTDILGMDGGLQYTDLTIAQGTGDNANNTIISAGSEYLAILEGIDVTDLTEADFTPVDIA